MRTGGADPHHRDRQVVWSPLAPVRVLPVSKAWAAGSTTRWRKLRAAILAENTRTNQGRCQLRLRGCTGQATQVHHVYGRQTTGDDPRHLVACCRSCNLAVGDPTTNRPMPRRVTRW